jgi:ATP-dependent Clp protease ATP-binding subunit ClpC
MAPIGSAFVFDRFTPRARQVFQLAAEEARGMNHAYIGTEHFLLGLIGEKEGVAARVLRSFGMKQDDVRSDVVRMVGLGDEPVEAPQLPFTPRMHDILELSKGEAYSLRHDHVGTEHLLLGLAREGNGVANIIMAEHGATSDGVREATNAYLRGDTPVN